MEAAIAFIGALEVAPRAGVWGFFQLIKPAS